MIMIICFALLAISTWYVPGRFKQLLALDYIWPWRLAAFLFLAGYILLMMNSGYASANGLVAAISNIYGLLFIFYVSLFLYLLAIHILSPLLKNLAGWGIALTGVLLCLVYVGSGFIKAQSFTVTSFVLPVRNLAAPVMIAHIPDLHLGAQRGEGYLNKVITAVNEQNPDMVLLNGDLVDSDIALKPELLSLLGNFAAETYFTTGNHEYYIDTPKALNLIESAGVKILRSEMVETNGLQLIGLEYMNADRQTHDPHMVNDLTIEEELPKIERNPNNPAVLMHHSPAGLQYVVDGNIDVILSGHTHGGQLFPGTLLAEMRYQINKGLRKIEGTLFLVSQGAGTFGPWMRQGTFNEVQMITLTPAHN